MREELDYATLVEPKLLLLFVLLYNNRSVSRAAEDLQQSQPNISAWLAKLREHFGDPLFVKTAGGMQPTPRADSLVDSIREAIQTLRRVSAPVGEFQPEKLRRSFRICMTDGSHMTLLPRLLKRVLERAPGVRIVATPIGDHSSKELEEGKADLALGIIPGLESGFYQQSFYEQDFICLTSPNHPNIHEKLSLKTYLEAAHADVLSGKSHSILQEALKAQRIERNIVLEIHSFLGLASVVGDSDLVATVPRQIGEAIARTAGLKVFKCPAKVPTFTVKQYWHVRMHHDPANRWLRSICADLYMNG
jgi:DNA-binding transcriptional LysR family regulator